MVILWVTYFEVLSSYYLQAEEDNELERGLEAQEEDEAEWLFDPAAADYQQLMEQQLDPIIPNYLEYKDYKEDYYPEA